MTRPRHFSRAYVVLIRELKKKIDAVEVNDTLHSSVRGQDQPCNRSLGLPSDCLSVQRPGILLVHDHTVPEDVRTMRGITIGAYLFQIRNKYLQNIEKVA